MNLNLIVGYSEFATPIYRIKPSFNNEIKKIILEKFLKENLTLNDIFIKCKENDIDKLIYKNLLKLFNEYLSNNKRDSLNFWCVYFDNIYNINNLIVSGYASK
jgi:hypothetical protein